MCSCSKIEDKPIRRSGTRIPGSMLSTDCGGGTRIIQNKHLWNVNYSRTFSFDYTKQLFSLSASFGSGIPFFWILIEVSVGYIARLATFAILLFVHVLIVNAAATALAPSHSLTLSFSLTLRLTPRCLSRELISSCCCFFSIYIFLQPLMLHARFRPFDVFARVNVARVIFRKIYDSAKVVAVRV